MRALPCGGDRFNHECIYNAGTLDDEGKKAFSILLNTVSQEKQPRQGNHISTEKENVENFLRQMIDMAKNQAGRNGCHPFDPRFNGQQKLDDSLNAFMNELYRGTQ